MLGRDFRLLFFEPVVLLFLVGAGALFLFLAAVLLRLLRGGRAQ
jgi:hypothetical protein